MQFPSAIDLRVQIYTFLYQYVRAHWSPSVLETVWKVGVQVAPAFFVQPDNVVHPFDGDTPFAVALPDTGNGLRRPMPF